MTNKTPSLPVFTKDDGRTIQYPLAPEISASRLGLGCMHFGGSWDDTAFTEASVAKARKAVETVLELGWNFFDHADIYCSGKSERVYARVMKELSLSRESVIIQSKCGIRFKGDGASDAPHRFDFSKAHILKSVDSILKRLDTDYLDILLLHRPDMLMEVEEIVNAFRRLREQGKVKRFGVSNHTPGLMRLMRQGGVEMVANQVEINVLKPSLLSSSIVAAGGAPAPGHPADGTLEFHRMKGIVTQAWAPMAYGYLSGRSSDTDHDRVRRAASVTEELAYKYGVHREAIVIAWLLRHPACIQPIIGTGDPGRLKACHEALRLTLSREDWYLLFTAGRGVNLP